MLVTTIENWYYFADCSHQYFPARTPSHRLPLSVRIGCRLSLPLLVPTLPHFLPFSDDSLSPETFSPQTSRTWQKPPFHGNDGTSHSKPRRWLPISLRSRSLLLRPGGRLWFSLRSECRLVGVGDVLRCAVGWGESLLLDDDRGWGQIL